MDLWALIIGAFFIARALARSSPWLVQASLGPVAVVALLATGALTARQILSGVTGGAFWVMLGLVVAGEGLAASGVFPWIHQRIGRTAGGSRVHRAVGSALIGALAAFVGSDRTVPNSLRGDLTRITPALTLGALGGALLTGVGTMAALAAGDLLPLFGAPRPTLYPILPAALAVFTLALVLGALWPEGREAAPPARELNLGLGWTALQVPASQPPLTLQEALGAAASRCRAVVTTAGGRTQGPNPETAIQPGDLLLLRAAPGELAPLLAATGRPYDADAAEDLRAPEGSVAAARLQLTAASTMVGRSLSEMRFRQRHWVVVVNVLRRGVALPERGEALLQPGDELLTLGRRRRIEELARQTGLHVVALGAPGDPLLEQMVVALRVPPGSPLVGTSVRGNQAGKIVRLSLVGVLREGLQLQVSQEDPIRAGDALLVAGEPEEILELLQAGVFGLGHPREQVTPDVALHPEMAPLASLTLPGFATLAALGAPLPAAAGIATLPVLAAQWRRASSFLGNLPWARLFELAWAIPLAVAVHGSGLAAHLAGWLPAEWAPRSLLLAALVAAVAAGWLVSELPAIALVGPLAWWLAQRSGSAPTAFLLGSAAAASLGARLPASAHRWPAGAPAATLWLTAGAVVLLSLLLPLV